MNDIRSSYRGNPLLKRAGAQISWTQEMIDEYMKCSKDPIYFIKKYVKVIHVDRGLIPLDLYGYQEEIINKAINNRNLIVCTARQSGKTTSIVGLVIWYVCFHPDKIIGILANKGSSSRKILSSIQLAYQYIPKFLQAAVVEWNKSSVTFANNSKILAEATSSDAVRGWSFSMIILDEAAFIRNYQEFAASVLPTISSGKTTKLIMISTPCGLNHFHRTWQESIEGRNEFQRVEVPWWKVPGRDEEWKQKTLADLNFDAEKFLQEYACVAGDTLINIRHKVTGEIKSITLRELYEEKN